MWHTLQRKEWKKFCDERGKVIPKLEGQLRKEKGLRERDSKTAVCISAQVKKDAEDEVPALDWAHLGIPGPCRIITVCACGMKESRQCGVSSSHQLSC